MKEAVLFDDLLRKVGGVVRLSNVLLNMNVSKDQMPRG
jgi:hypothetical protein